MNSDNPNNPRQLSFTEEDEATESPNTQRSDSDAASIDRSALGNDNAFMETIVDDLNFETAWAKVKANRGAPGPDGITVEDFPDWFRPQWETVRQQLVNGTYRPAPVRRVSIDKPDGGTRDLGIPNLIDRVIQQAAC